MIRAYRGRRTRETRSRRFLRFPFLLATTTCRTELQGNRPLSSFFPPTKSGLSKEARQLFKMKVTSLINRRLLGYLGIALQTGLPSELDLDLDRSIRSDKNVNQFLRVRTHRGEGSARGPYVANCERIDRFLCARARREGRSHYSGGASGAVCSGLRAFCP